MHAISIVVPAYNAARRVAATLESLLGQSQPALDIVVVDDGSKDETQQALEPYRDRARVIRQQNAGVSVARNRGVAEARGEWIAFCDADDLWHPDKLKVVSAVLDAGSGCDLVFHDFWTFTGDTLEQARATHSRQTLFPLFNERGIRMPEILTKAIAVAVPDTPFGAVSTWHGDALRWLIVGNFLQPSTVIVRKSTFQAAGGFDPEFRYAEDTEFFLRFAKRTPFLWIDESLTGYRREAGTLLTGNMLRTIRNGTRAVVKHSIETPVVFEDDPSWVRRSVARRYARLSYCALSELETAEARASARAAVALTPWYPSAWALYAGSLVPKGLLHVGRRLKTAVSRRRA